MVPESVICSSVVLGSWIPNDNDIGVYLRNTQRHRLASTDLQKLLRIAESPMTLYDITVS